MALAPQIDDLGWSYRVAEKNHMKKNSTYGMHFSRVTICLCEGYLYQFSKRFVER